MEQGPITTRRRGSSWRKIRMTRSRLRATVALACSLTGETPLMARGASSGTISLTCKSCVRYMGFSIAEVGASKSLIADAVRKSLEGDFLKHRLLYFLWDCSRND